MPFDSDRIRTIIRKMEDDPGETLPPAVQIVYRSAKAQTLAILEAAAQLAKLRECVEDAVEFMIRPKKAATWEDWRAARERKDTRKV